MRRKAAKIDYSKSMLPRKRREQFFDCFKMNFSVILKCGLVFLIFLLPLFVYSAVMDFVYISIINNIEEELEGTILVWHYFFNAGLIILAIPAALGLTGVVRILRNLIWGEGIFFWHDFFGAIRQNGLKNAIFTLVFGALYGAAYFVISMFKGTVIDFVAYFALLIFAFIFLPIYFWIIYLNNTYNSKVAGLIRNGLFFYTKTIGWSILLSAISILFAGFLFLDISLVILKYIIMVVLTIVFYPTIFLIMTLYSTAKFDEFINKENYNIYYKRGLNND